MLWHLHANNVRHNDFEPRNVLRKPWARFVIIDFALAETDHVCPGWEACRELQEALRALDLTSLASRVRQLERNLEHIQSRIRPIPTHAFGDKLHPACAFVLIFPALPILILILSFLLHFS